ncbi:MAG: Hsp20/alpha crystallin family protein [Treponema sp.]|jgi:HSP20 family protein|nr:Hsp20/alpha crystallin family protein [Treponema sp.]
MKTLTMYPSYRWGPNTIQNALSDFDRYFESFFGASAGSENAILAPVARLFNQAPAVDIQETENAYVLEMDLPGFDEKNINVHVDGSNLTVSSKQEKKSEENQGSPNEPISCSEERSFQSSYILRERRLSSFSRSFKLPENANPEAVSAVFKNGILSLQIQKRAEAQKRAIQINAA